MVGTEERLQKHIKDFGFKELHSKIFNIKEEGPYCSSTTTSSCWVYCRARRSARSFASELRVKVSCYKSHSHIYQALKHAVFVLVTMSVLANSCSLRK